MNSKQIIKHLTDFSKTVFNNNFELSVTLQNETDSLMKKILDEHTWIPKQGKDLINDWLNNYQKVRDECMSAIDEYYKKVAAYVDGLQAEEQKTQKGK